MWNFAKKWIIAIRLWTLTASIIPVSLGFALAWYEFKISSSDWSISYGLFALTLLAGICLQACANLLNTYGDYVSGIDTSETKMTNRELIEGSISIKSMKNVASMLVGIALLCGVILIFYSDFTIVAFGIVGILGALSYTTGIFPYKYHALGTIFVFFLMGPLMVLPAYYIESGQLTLNALLFSLPISFLVSLILFGNEIRDLQSDKEGGIRTLAMIFGLEKALKVYIALIYASYISLILLFLLGIIPFPALFPLVLLPILKKQIARMKTPLDEEVRVNLVRFSAKIHFLFGLLFFIGILV